jgi:hypothetical protein
MRNSMHDANAAQARMMPDYCGTNEKRAGKGRRLAIGR